MRPELWTLYAEMLRSRLFEEAIAKLWHDGLISGEMHLGTGEEAIVAGILAHLRDGDAMALDHRGSAALLMRGVDPVLILRELLGYPDGLSGGMGGHMHLFSREHLAASTGIVGAGGPTATGFALAAQYLRPESVAVGFFGEGAMNQGMLLESLNLASVWNLPAIFVCKDDGWSITTPSETMTGGNLDARASALGLRVMKANGADVEDVWETAHSAIQHVRNNQGPVFLHARCVHLEAHFLGFQLTRIARHPIKEIPAIAAPLAQSWLRPGGAGMRERTSGLRSVIDAVIATVRDQRQDRSHDPLVTARRKLKSDPERLASIEDETRAEIDRVISTSLLENSA